MAPPTEKDDRASSYLCATIHIGERDPETEQAVRDGLSRLAEERSSFIRTQLELASAEGSHHFQTAYRCATTLRPSTLSKLLKKYVGIFAHCSRARNPVAAFAYSEKLDTRVDGPWDFGKPLPISNHGGSRRGEKPSASAQSTAALVKFATSCPMDVDPRVIIRLRPELFISNESGKSQYLSRMSRPRGEDPVTVLWLHGPSNTGKSTIMKMIASFADAYVCPAAYSSGGQRWMSGYAGESAVLIDELEPTHFSCDMLKMMLRPGPCYIPVGQGGKTGNFVATLILITSQHSLYSWRSKVWKRRDIEALANRIEWYETPLGRPLLRARKAEGAAKRDPPGAIPRGAIRCEAPATH